MMRTGFLVLLGAAFLAAQEGPPGTKVEIKGSIERIRMAPGKGMPQLEVKSGNETITVMLGSLRYLMEQNFNPKAGQQVVVSGFRSGDMVIAQRVELAGRVLQLRDKDGRPLWRMGPGGRKQP